MPWRPLPQIAFAVCIYPFQPSSAADLPLEIGDELYIIEQGGAGGAWYRGYLVAPPSLLAGLTSSKGKTLEARVFSGIFPRCCVEVREVLGENRTKGQAESGQEASSPEPRPTTGYSGHGPPNGVVTPSETGSTASGSAKASKNASKQEFLMSPGGRLVRANSEQDVTPNRSGSLPNILPLSPISVSPREPDAPKPPAPVPMLKIGDETPTSAQEPLVDEIASCLREWHSTKLHELLLTRRYKLLDKMSDLVQRLDASRRQLLHHVLTKQELRDLRERTVWDLVRGNKILSGEVIVRSPSDRGRILTAEDSAVDVTRLQSMMSLLDKRPTTPPDVHNLHHLLVQLKNTFDAAAHGCQVLVCLCIKTPGAPTLPLTECFSIDTPVPEQCGDPALENTMRTFYTDLSSTNIGEGPGSGSQLYLVLKVFANEPMRVLTSSGAGSGHSRQGTPERSSSGIGSSNVGSVRISGRRSLMWGKGRRESEPERPRTGERNAENKPSSRSASISQAKPVRRIVGLGALRVDSVMRANDSVEQDIQIWAPSLSASEDQENGSFEGVINELFPSPTGNYKKYALIPRVRGVVQAFADPDAEKLIRKTPTLLHDVLQTRKIGFSGAPTKSRSDIYVTLAQPFLPRNALLSHPKSGTVPLNAVSSMGNLQLTLEVRRSNGERIENCIHPSGNSTGHTAWRTPAVERGQAWNLTIQLAISPEDVPGSHLVMSIADAPDFPFALCWMPLWVQEAFIRDGEHSLALYKYDEYTSSVISGKHAYMALPWSSRRKDESVVGPMAGLHLRTYLCSTKYSQDPNLLGLLKWRDQQALEDLTGLLKRFAFVPEIEIVKLLNETFDALFEILVEYSGRDEYEDLVFNALVLVLGIVHDRRFKLGPLVDQYTENRFRYPFVTSSLTRSFIRLLANPSDSNSSRKLRATFKVGRHVFKFIMRARQLQKEKEAEIGINSRQESFMKDLKTMFKSLEKLMANGSPALIGTKTLLVQNFHNWLPELSLSWKPEDTLHVASSFVDSCETVQGKLILYKLVLLINFAQVEDFKLPETRRTLLQNTVRWLAPYWGHTDEVSEQWRSQVRLCCSVVASQVEYLGEEASEYLPKLVGSYRAIQQAPRESKNSLSLLFPTSYPFPSRPTTTSAYFDEPLVEISALLASTSSLPASLQLDLPEPALADLLLNTLHVYLSILDGEAFPSSWLSVHIYHHRATMGALENLSNILIDRFLPDPDDADSFNTELWRAFFDTLLKLVGSDALALETFPEQKRRAVWKVAGDVRELGAELLRRTWDAIGWETSPEDKKEFGLEKMGGYQVQYVPGLVEPIVELCLSVHEGLRCVAIEVLQTMIVSEWTLSSDLSIIQAEMIECLDRMFKSKQLTESIIQKLFIGELLNLFEPMAKEDDSETSLYAAVKSLLGVLDELLDLLVAVHSTEATGEAFHIMDTLHLMDFLKDMQKEDIYIRYVHQLAEIQVSARNNTEAGLALRLHADLHDWDPSINVEALADPSFPAQTAFERKEALYFQMIKHYEEGMSWENALGAYIELAEQYEHNTFDFAKLARAQRAMATIYESIHKGERQTPRFFRVIYKGLGFPVGLRDKQFIFEGSPLDRMATFTDKMQQLHPAAQILQAGVEEDLEGQFLQIFPVSPFKDLYHPILQRSKTAQPVRDYYLLARPDHFTITTRRLGTDLGIHEQTTEKTVFATAESFPTIVRRTEITEIYTTTLSPLETAIERTMRKTAELIMLEKRTLDGDPTAYTSLTESIMASVDPASDTSVSLYRVLLPAPPEPNEDGIIEEQAPLEPIENALKIALIEHALAIKRAFAVFAGPAHQATRVELSQRFEITFGPELDTLVVTTAVPAARTPSPWLAHPSNGQPAHSPEAKPSSPPQTAQSRKPEKNRLSLQFLKRSSMLNSNSQPNHKAIPKDTSPSQPRTSNVSKPGTSSGAPNGAATYNTFPAPFSDRSSSRGRGAGGSRGGGSSTGRDGYSKSSSRSQSSEQEAQAGAGRVGSVKKRLSLLNIARKNSRMKLQGALVEE